MPYQYQAANEQARFPREDGKPPQRFGPAVLSDLKTIVILSLATAMESQIDIDMAQALIKGDELSNSQLQHILDEARDLTLPSRLQKLLQAIHNALEADRQASAE